MVPGGSGGSGGIVSVQLQQGAPAPDGSLDNPIPADGARVYVGETGATPVQLTAAGSGSYYSTGLVLTPGKEYTLSVDVDGNGSIDGTGKAFAVGTPAWTSPTEGASVPAASFVASWTDSGVTTGGAGYAPVYYVTMAGSGVQDYAYYLGTDRSFSPRSMLSTATPPAPLAPGAYGANIWVFSGPFSATGGNFTTTNNVTGQGVTGQFMSFGSAATVNFTVQ